MCDSMVTDSSLLAEEECVLASAAEEELSHEVILEVTNSESDAGGDHEEGI